MSSFANNQVTALEARTSAAAASRWTGGDQTSRIAQSAVVPHQVLMPTGPAPPPPIFRQAAAAAHVYSVSPATHCIDRYLDGCRFNFQPQYGGLDQLGWRWRGPCDLWFRAPGGIGTGSATFGTSTFSNNQANPGNGGGILVESLATTVATTSFTNNSAGNRGGGIFVGGASLLLNGTSPSITFTGNTATNGGSSVSTSRRLTSRHQYHHRRRHRGQHAGSWTNNAGSTLRPQTWWWAALST